MADADERERHLHLARCLMRGTGVATLATVGRGDGWPFASLTQTACAIDGRPLMLLSTLAAHTRNLMDDDRVAVLFDGSGDRDERLMGARLTVQGRARTDGDPALRARYLARHPGAAQFAEFSDFSVYAVAVERAHLVAGFGKVARFHGDQLLGPAAPDLALAETDLLAALNADCTRQLDRIKGRLGGDDGEGCVLSGIDPHGCDLRCGALTVWLPFSVEIRDAQAAQMAVSETLGNAVDGDLPGGLT